MPKIPKPPSKGEELFWQHCQAYGLTPEREYKFMEDRRYRLDFAWPEHKLAVEVEGGTWSNGRHSRGAGFEADCRKYANAGIKGWIVMRFTTEMVETCEAIDFVRSALTL